MIGVDEPPVIAGEELSQQDQQRLAMLGKQDLFFFSRGILRYRDIVPRVHRDLCRYLVDPTERRKLVLMPRSHFKTTIGLSNLLRRICIDPNVRILLANESGKNASLMLTEIKQHILENELFRAIYPEIVPKNHKATTWNSEEILLPRTLIAREPTIMTIGVGGAVVSRHFNLMYFDDLIGEEALHSPAVMQTAISWLNHSVSLLIKPIEDDMILIGTRWAYNDLYAHAIANMGFKQFRRKAIVLNPETGQPESLFGERFSLEFFAGIMQTDPQQWAAQYANDPSDVAFADFQKHWLRYYTIAPDGEIRWVDHDGILNKQSLNKLRVYVHVDPSIGEKPDSDETAVVTVGVNQLGQVFVLDVWERRVDPMMLIEKLFELNDRFDPKLISIESTAFQKSLRYYIENESKRRGVYLRIEDYKPSTRKNKQARIRGALQPYFSSGLIFIRTTMLNLVEEYLAFGRTDKDHAMDALAQGPQFWRAPHDDAGLEKHARLRDSLLTSKPFDLGISGYGIGLPSSMSSNTPTRRIFTG